MLRTTRKSNSKVRHGEMQGIDCVPVSPVSPVSGRLCLEAGVHGRTVGIFVRCRLFYISTEGWDKGSLSFSLSFFLSFLHSWAARMQRIPQGSLKDPHRSLEILAGIPPVPVDPWTERNSAGESCQDRWRIPPATAFLSWPTVDRWWWITWSKADVDIPMTSRPEID